MLLNRDRALAVMDEHGLDALVATTPENVHYLSDYGTQHSYNFAPWGISAAVLPRDEDIPPTLMVHEFEVPAVTVAVVDAGAASAQRGRLVRLRPR